MFDTTANLWLQSWASPTLTFVMNAISVAGYVPSATAIALVYAFGWNVRRGVAILMVVATAAVLASAAKSAFAQPRPTDVDRRVLALGSVRRLPLANQLPASVVHEDTFGFPSGHVAAATALTLTVWWMTRRRRWLVASAIWIVLMALSRVYLGRHFIGDTLGGVGVGILGLAAAWMAFDLGAIVRGAHRVKSPPLIRVTGACAIAIGLAVLGFGQPLDAGRFVGLGVALILVSSMMRLEKASEPVTRMAQVLVAFLLLAVAIALPVLLSAASFAMLVASAVAYAAMLLAPMLLSKVNRL